MQVFELLAAEREQSLEVPVVRREEVRRRDVVVHGDHALVAVGEESTERRVADREVDDEQVRARVGRSEVPVRLEGVHFLVHVGIAQRREDLRRPDLAQEPAVLERRSGDGVARHRRDHELMDLHQRVAITA